MTLYPSSVAEVLDPPVRFRAATIDAVDRFAQSRPWTGTLEERKEKFSRLHGDLCRIYTRQTQIRFRLIDGSCSGSSFYMPALDLIEIRGKLSVVTYLHEFAHALGKDEHGACRWSLNLFRKCCPREFGRCRDEGHVVR